MKAILAHCNYVIGRGNEIPWHFSKDFRFFREMTSGETVVMGGNTFRSLIKIFDCPNRVFPDRHKVIISNTYKEMIFYDIYTLEEFPIDKLKDAFVIGGKQIYKKLWQYIDEVYCTEISNEYYNDFLANKEDLVSISKDLFNGFQEVETTYCTDIDKKSGKEYQLKFSMLTRNVKNSLHS